MMSFTDYVRKKKLLKTIGGREHRGDDEEEEKEVEERSRRRGLVGATKTPMNDTGGKPEESALSFSQFSRKNKLKLKMFGKKEQELSPRSSYHDSAKTVKNGRNKPSYSPKLHSGRGTEREVSTNTSNNLQSLSISTKGESFTSYVRDKNEREKVRIQRENARRRKEQIAATLQRPRKGRKKTLMMMSQISE